MCIFMNLFKNNILLFCKSNFELIRITWNFIIKTYYLVFESKSNYLLFEVMYVLESELSLNIFSENKLSWTLENLHYLIRLIE